MLRNVPSMLSENIIIIIIEEHTLLQGAKACYFFNELLNCVIVHVYS